MLCVCKEVGRLAQGYCKGGTDDYAKGTNTCFFLYFNEIQNIPKDQVYAYAQIVVNCRPQKKDKNIVGVTVDDAT